VFESQINVEREHLESAIAKSRPLTAPIASGLTARTAENGSVLLQTMVPAEYSGVLFTRDPSASGLMIVES